MPSSRFPQTNYNFGWMVRAEPNFEIRTSADRRGCPAGSVRNRITSSKRSIAPLLKRLAGSLQPLSPGVLFVPTTLYPSTTDLRERSQEVVLHRAIFPVDIAKGNVPITHRGRRKIGSSVQPESDDLGKILGLETGPADQGAVHSGYPHDFDNVVGFHITAIKDSDG